MNTLERLRPDPRPLDAEWSAATLESILSDFDPSTVRRGRKGRRSTVIVASILGLGGVAYATGLVPALVSDDLDAISPSEVSNVHEVATFSTGRDGRTRTFEIWRGINERGQSCTSVLEAQGKFGPEFGGYCGDYPTDAWFDRTSESWRGTINDTPPPSTVFVYGEPTLAGVTTVRVLGDGFEHDVQVDQRTGGYAVAVPELGQHISGHFATVEFLDAAGNVVGRSELSEK